MTGTLYSFVSDAWPEHMDGTLAGTSCRGGTGRGVTTVGVQTGKSTRQEGDSWEGWHSGRERRQTWGAEHTQWKSQQARCLVEMGVTLAWYGQQGPMGDPLEFILSALIHAFKVLVTPHHPGRKLGPHGTQRTHHGVHAAVIGCSVLSSRACFQHM